MGNTLTGTEEGSPLVNGTSQEYADFEDYEPIAGVDALFGSNHTEDAANLSNSNDSYYVNYDYNITNDIPIEEFVPVSLFYGMTLLLGVTGNLLVIFAIARYKSMQSVTNIFLTSLATADLLLVLLCVPIKFAKFFSFSWDFGEFLCKMVHYMQNVSVICSVLTLTTMSIERYYAILHPMKAKYSCTTQRARRLIIGLWILSFILAVPIIFGQVHEMVGAKYKVYWCYKTWPTPFTAKLYEVGMLLLILVFPLCVMSFAYASICVELWLVTSNRAKLRAGNMGYHREINNAAQGKNDNNISSSAIVRRRPKVVNDDDSTRKQVIKMLVTIIVLFAVCWAPCLIDSVLVAFGILEELHYGYLKHMRQIFSLLSYFNSCINPWVYAFMSKNFRESFKYALCACARGEKYARRLRYKRNQSFATRTTSVHSDFSRSTSNGAMYGVKFTPEEEIRGFMCEESKA